MVGHRAGGGARSGTRRSRSSPCSQQVERSEQPDQPARPVPAARPAARSPSTSTSTASSGQCCLHHAGGASRNRTAGRRRRTEQPHVRVDHPQVLRGGRGSPATPAGRRRQPRDAPQHRRRGARLQLQPAETAASRNVCSYTWVARQGWHQRGRAPAGARSARPTASPSPSAGSPRRASSWRRRRSPRAADPRRGQRPGSRLEGPSPASASSYGEIASSRRAGPPAGSSAVPRADSRPGQAPRRRRGVRGPASGTPRLASAQLAPSRPVSWTPRSRIAASVSARAGSGARSSCCAAIR